MKPPFSKMQGDQSITPETTPIYPSSVYTFSDLDAVRAYYATTAGGEDSTRYLYRRNGHPNERPVETKIAALEQAEDATLFASGMAAISQSCFALLRPGDHVVATRHLYGGTYAFFAQILEPWGVEVTYADFNDAQSLATVVKSTTRMLYAETIANPLLQVLDIEAVGAFAAGHDLQFLVDNTFATPLLTRPLRHGATLSIHSLTKYLNGHSDVIAGAVAGDAETVATVRQFAATFGATLSPFDAWLTERGLQTLHLRFPAQCANAEAIARLLSEQPCIQRVYYPGLTTHPTHDVATRALSSGYGAMVSFELQGGVEAADTFIRRLQHIHFAPSLGGVHTTVSHPALTSHRAYTPEAREQLGIDDGLIRLSVGCEPCEEIQADILRALTL